MKTVKELFDLTGKTALVTGSASGIGQGIALALAEAGADIIGTYRRTSPEETAGMIEGAGRKFEPVQADLADSKQRSDVIEKVLKDYKEIDILVNGMGISNTNPVTKFDYANYDKTLETNLNAAVELSVALSSQWV